MGHGRLYISCLKRDQVSYAREYNRERKTSVNALNAVLPATDSRSDDNEKERCPNDESCTESFLRTRKRAHYR